MFDLTDGDADEDSVAAGEVDFSLGCDEFGTLKPLPFQPSCEVSGIGMSCCGTLLGVGGVALGIGVMEISDGVVAVLDVAVGFAVGSGVFCGDGVVLGTSKRPRCWGVADEGGVIFVSAAAVGGGIGVVVEATDSAGVGARNVAVAAL